MPFRIYFLKMEMFTIITVKSSFLLIWLAHEIVYVVEATFFGGQMSSRCLVCCASIGMRVDASYQSSLWFWHNGAFLYNVMKNTSMFFLRVVIKYKEGMAKRAYKKRDKNDMSVILQDDYLFSFRYILFS